ncbi:carbohydrate ABC transporter permease [Infirmifilum lucidum]|uniref:Carbohydrate ABC transporter permease n=1 Tax=Infirmifilum lucidum TaxID=2776706 RepID=A0A7L9FJR7_9CREN|nr:carbohydrate ABC transporter permease [Infirmifilum lucidum]QOJ79174.1 carbohydrate ABC transporter permease [Infirmifilum lucidum]
MRRTVSARRVLVSTALLVFAALWALPFIGLVVTSLKPYSEVILHGWWSMGGTYSLKNYIEALQSPFYNLMAGFRNSFIVATASTFIPVLLASLLAYSLSYLDFKGKTTLFVSILFMMSVPQQMVVIPLYMLYAKIGLLDKLLGLILLHSAWGVPWITFFMRNYLKMIPSSLVESARVDGASETTILMRILIPVITPAVIAASAIQFTWVWGDFFYAMVFLASPDNWVITQRIALLKGEYHIDWGLLSAGAILALIPPLVIYTAFRKYYVRGFAGWALKG